MSLNGEGVSMYKFKGKGNKREVYDGAMLVGRLVRHERPVTYTTYCYDRAGRQTGATFRKSVEVWWRAYDSDGRRLGRGDPWKGVSCVTLKEWSDPKAWEGLVTTGDLCVTP